MNFVESPAGCLRLGWTLPRQVGPAVVRNRLKRWSRVYFRECVKAGDIPPVDLNLVFRKTEGDFYKKLSYERFASVVDKGWKQIQSRRATQKPASRPEKRSETRSEKKNDADD
jgi:ribonuclease P protein component